MSRVLPHLSAEALKQKFRTAKNFWQQQKWLVIYRTHLTSMYHGEIRPYNPLI
ncbi:hypothetical protein AVDCRST_MAG94-2287 [uncultured Leptolyngbya sp.]|uniref:Uncharacterized protein n=1 Tax=uncultured Leptolyngbya sp. TaxID=332963 RepID=A0A6J4LSR1_9CYAN|nr:hypothetical protein AVDCRST_MAG94-2287 [uncultured Leptolyngbya sp.]